MRTLDLRTRCQRCRRIPRGKLRLAEYELYKPYCSFHCQEWARLEDAQRYINERRMATGGLLGPTDRPQLVGEQANEEMDYRRTKDAKARGDS